MEIFNEVLSDMYNFQQLYQLVYNVCAALPRYYLWLCLPTTITGELREAGRKMCGGTSTFCLNGPKKGEPGSLDTGNGSEVTAFGVKGF